MLAILISCLGLFGLSAYTAEPVIAFPITWLAMTRWLLQYAYRVEIEWWIFIVAMIAAMGIALITISFQSVRAALMNPVKSLRSE